MGHELVPIGLEPGIVDSVDGSPPLHLLLGAHHFLEQGEGEDRIGLVVSGVYFQLDIM